MPLFKHGVHESSDEVRRLNKYQSAYSACRTWQPSRHYTLYT